MNNDLRQLRICTEKLNPEKYKKHVTTDANGKNKLSAAFLTSNIWSSSAKIRIGFITDGITSANPPSFTPLSTLKSFNRPMDPYCATIIGMTPQAAVIKVVSDRIFPIAGLDMAFVTDVTQANIRISFDSTLGAWSYIGTDALNYTDSATATTNFGWIDTPTLIHEFGHILGMIHEHQNPNGNPIDWNVPVATQYFESTQNWSAATVQTNIFQKYAVDQINGSVFDPNSIMLYFFPASLTLNNQGTNENLMLSSNDVIYINKNYPNSALTPAQFYQNVYGVDISAALAQSGSTVGNLNSTVVFIIRAMLIILLLFNVYLFFNTGEINTTYMSVLFVFFIIVYLVSIKYNLNIFN